MANLTFVFFGAKVRSSIEELLKSKSRTCFKIFRITYLQLLTGSLMCFIFQFFACALPLVYCYLCVRVCA